jgi:hypothetical protein
MMYVVSAFRRTVIRVRLKPDTTYDCYRCGGAGGGTPFN